MIDYCNGDQQTMLVYVGSIILIIRDKESLTEKGKIITLLIM